MYKKIFYIMIIAVLLTGCGRNNTSTPDTDEVTEGKHLTIVATLFPQYDFARRIAGEYAEVIMLLPPGMESHSYDLRPADMITIRESDIFIYTGKYMETWAQTIIDSLDGSVTVVDASEGITLSKETDYYIEEHVHEDDGNHEHEDQEHEADGHAEDENHEHEADEHGEGGDLEDEAHEHEEDEDHEGVLNHGHEEEAHEYSGHHHEYDPHIWTNPVFAISMVENITNALCTRDPEHAVQYRERADEYISELEELDAAFREIADEAQYKTIFFGGRFAMSYFVQEYGFDCLAAYHDCSAESEPSISSVMRMIDEIREHNAKAVYYEELADPKVARTIAEETGAKLLLLHSAHNVTKEDFDNGITYLDIMWQNAERLKEGLY